MIALRQDVLKFFTNRGGTVSWTVIRDTADTPSGWLVTYVTAAIASGLLIDDGIRVKLP